MHLGYTAARIISEVLVINTYYSVWDKAKCRVVDPVCAH